MGSKMMKYFLIVCGIVVFVVGLLLILAWPFMWMWNFAVVAAITVANPVDYWVAFCLMMFICLFVAGSKGSK